MGFHHEGHFYKEVVCIGKAHLFAFDLEGDLDETFAEILASALETS